MRATFRGPGGHGSMPMRGGAMAQPGRVPARRSTASACRCTSRRSSRADGRGHRRRSCRAPAAARPARPARPAPDRPRCSTCSASAGALFDPLLHNTVNPTIVARRRQASTSSPPRSSVELDGRLLPGQTPDDLLRELRALARRRRRARGRPPRARPARARPRPVRPARRRAARAPTRPAPPIPLLLPGDHRRAPLRPARHPGLRLHADAAPAGLRASPRLIHAADERVPADAVGWGADRVLRRRSGATDGLEHACPGLVKRSDADAVAGRARRSGRRAPRARRGRRRAPARSPPPARRRRRARTAARRRARGRAGRAPRSPGASQLNVSPMFVA